MVVGQIAICNEVQFRSKSLVCYQSFHKLPSDQQSTTSGEVLEYRMSASFKANAAKLRDRAKYTGQITAGAKKRLTKAISLLIQSSPEKYIYNQVTKKTQHHKLSFITLTMPPSEKSRDAKFCHKELLQPMIRILRNKYKMKSYVWKCELQKNGSIHYHLTTELFLVWEQLRQHWNAILRLNGMLDAFIDQYGHDNPNSVDIHSVQRVNDLEAYLVKYISKEYQNGVALDGKVWDCSRNLKEGKYFTQSLDHEMHAAIIREIELGWLTPIYRDRCVILRAKTTDYYQSFSQPLIDTYYSHLNSITSWQKPTKKTATRLSNELTAGSNISSRTDVFPHGKSDGSSMKTSKRISQQLTISSFTSNSWLN